MRLFILTSLCSIALGAGWAYTEPGPASHEVKVWGTIQEVNAERAMIWIKTPRQVVPVTVGSDTRVRLGGEESRLTELRAGQAVRTLNQWRDGVLLCRELVVIQPDRPN